MDWDNSNSIQNAIVMMTMIMIIIIGGRPSRVSGSACGIFEVSFLRFGKLLIPVVRVDCGRANNGMKASMATDTSLSPRSS